MVFCLFPPNKTLLVYTVGCTLMCLNKVLDTFVVRSASLAGAYLANITGPAGSHGWALDGCCLFNFGETLFRKLSY